MHDFRRTSDAARAVILIVLILLLVSALKSFGINQEYQRGVLFRLGRLGAMKGPGWYWLIPFVDRVVRGRPADHHLSAGNAGDDHP